MSRLLNLGSLNLDLVYRIEHPLRPGETVASQAFTRGAGGKGLNQSLAAARAGINVAHAGSVGQDGGWLVDFLRADGVDVSRITRREDVPTGHAVILVAASGENAIVLQGGANHTIDSSALDRMFEGFGPGDWFLTQNETSAVGAALRLAHEHGMRLAFNPAPMSATVLDLPLDLVDLLVVNETEAAALAGTEDPATALAELHARLPRTQIVLTLGAAGAWSSGPRGEARAVPPRVHVLDTTAAGDTFIGFLLASQMQGEALESGLQLACRAAALSTTRAGAAASIPTLTEVLSLTAPEAPTRD